MLEPASSHKNRNTSSSELPPIPSKRYFTIGEVSELCAVKPHVLRYWEQEFPQLKPAKRRGNRRYYQHHDVVMIRDIRELLYEKGFTIGGARQQLSKSGEPVSTVVSSEPVIKQPSLNTKLVSELRQELEELLTDLSE